MKDNIANDAGIIPVSWPAPKHVKAFFTTRTGGVSKPPFDTFNLADHVGDASSDVAQNRERLKNRLALPAEPAWINQVHGKKVVCIDETDPTARPECDATYTTKPNHVCVVLTADCLPVLIYCPKTQKVAAIHAGWKGLLVNIIAETLSHFTVSDELLVWLGPAIGPKAFEVGDDVYQAFLDEYPQLDVAFAKHGARYLGDMYAIAKHQLASLGVGNIYGGDYCTYTDESLFFSYRRSEHTGRMASLIWFE